MLYSSHEFAALQLLTDAAAARTEQLQPHSTFRSDADDDEREDDCPVYNLCIEQGGAEDNLTATNSLSPRECLKIWDKISGVFSRELGGRSWAPK